MKKIFTAVLILFMLVLSTVNCFAAVSSDDVSEISPQYVVTSYHTEEFTVSNSGMVFMKGRLEPVSSDAVDQVEVTLTIKNEAGTAVYNKTYDATWSSVDKIYSVAKNCQLGEAGRYTFRATYKCYKNGSLIETIKSDPLYKSYR